MTFETALAKCDVAIIGFGPIGATLANILGHYGISTVILDRHSSLYQLPRAVSVDDEVMRIFQAIGLADDIADIVEIGAGAHFVDGGGKLLLEFLRPLKITSNGWHMNNRFHQPSFEAILRAGLGRFSCVTTLLEREVLAFDEDKEGVTVRCANLVSGEIESVRTAFVVGCDGAHSFTREAIGSGIEDLGFHEPWLVVDLISTAERPDFSTYTVHHCDSERPASCIFVGRNRKRWEFRLQPGDDPEQMAIPKNIWRLLEKWIRPDEAELERAVVYTFRSCIARQWRRDRLLIAGDAAHQMPPFMAQGMCSGIRDCANLGWKLDRIINGHSSHDLLDTYQSERYPHVRTFIDLTVQMGHLINKTVSELASSSVSKPDVGPQQLFQLSPTLGPSLSAGLTDWTGHLFPQLLLSTGQRLDDRIGLRLALILSEGFVDKELAGVKCDIADLDIAVINNSSLDVQTWLKARHINAVLVRPDRYILGAANTLDELRELIYFVSNL